MYDSAVLTDAGRAFQARAPLILSDAVAWHPLISQPSVLVQLTTWKDSLPK